MTYDLDKVTPRPWFLDRSSIPATEDCEIRTSDSAQEGALIATVHQQFGDQTTNAAHIVHAVNNHEALVEALTRLASEVRGCIHMAEPELREALGNTNYAILEQREAEARAALAAAKGEK